MADNGTAASGPTIAWDDIGSVAYQRVKVTYGVDGVAADVSPASPLPVGNNATASGTLSASDAVVAAPVGDGTLVSGASTAGSVVAAAVPNGMIAWTLLIKGYVSGAIYTEASTNSTNGTDGDWVEVKGRRTGTAVGTESVVYTMVSNGYYRGNCAGFTYLRARLIGGTGPTVAFTLSNGQGATFLNSGIPAGSSVIGGVTMAAPAADKPAVTITSKTATGVLFSVDTTGYSGVSWQSNTGWSAQVNFEGSNDNATWVAVTGAESNGNGISNATLVAGRPYVIPAVFRYIRANVASYTSGTIGGSAVLLSGVNTTSIMQNNMTIGQTSAFQLQMTNTPVTPTPYQLSSLATTNLLNVKSSAGTLLTLTASNNGAAAAFVKIYNLAVAPTLASSVPALTIPIPASSVVSLNLGAAGHRFSTGISHAITNLVADTDATAVAAAQVKLLLDYI